MGAGFGGLGRPVRGHSEVKGISTRGQGAGVWGCLGSSRGGWGVECAGRAGSWRGGHGAPGCVPSGLPEPQGPGRPRPGAWRSPQTRGCEGAARGFRARIPRRADPSPLRAPPPGRGPAWPAICFTSTPPPPPGPPRPQECSGSGGRGRAWRGGGRDRCRPSLRLSPPSPMGLRAGGSGGRLELSGA